MLHKVQMTEPQEASESPPHTWAAWPSMRGWPTCQGHAWPISVDGQAVFMPCLPPRAHMVSLGAPMPATRSPGSDHQKVPSLCILRDGGALLLHELGKHHGAPPTWGSEASWAWFGGGGQACRTGVTERNSKAAPADPPAHEKKSYLQLSTGPPSQWHRLR